MAGEQCKSRLQIDWKMILVDFRGLQLKELVQPRTINYLKIPLIKNLRGREEGLKWNKLYFFYICISLSVLLRKFTFEYF